MICICKVNPIIPQVVSPKCKLPLENPFLCHCTVPWNSTFSLSPFSILRQKGYKLWLVINILCSAITTNYSHNLFMNYFFQKPFLYCLLKKFNLVHHVECCTISCSWHRDIFEAKDRPTPCLWWYSCILMATSQ